MPAAGSRRTFLDYKHEVLRALGNPAEADLDGVSLDDMVNDALEHIAALHEWRWLQTGQISLDVTADQDYVELPADFGTLTAIQYDTGWGRQMIPVTWGELLELRAGTVRDWNLTYWYAINTGNVEEGNEDAGLSLPTLNLYPTPSADAAGVITMVYRRFLRRLSADSDRPQWPAYMDRALSLLCRGFASTDYDDDFQSIYTQEFTSLIPDLKIKDGLSVKSFGQPRGGLYPRTIPVSPFYPRSIPDPS